MKIGLLAWDRGVEDPDSPGLAEMGRERGHDTTLFTMDEISYTMTSGSFDVLVAGEPARSFDAIISRANIYGDWQHQRYDDGLRDRMERLTLLSSVPGLPLFDPADVWFVGHNKFLNAQRLTAAGLPTPLTRSATTLADVAAAVAEWGMAIIKPSFSLRGFDVERISDLRTEADLVQGLLAKYGTLVCQAYHPTEYGEYRITVGGEATPINMLKLPAAGSWRCKTLEGASFERFDAPPDLVDLALRATRVMGLTLAGLDILPTRDGYVILEVNPVPGFLNIFGEEPRRAVLAGVYEWVEKHAARSMAV